MTSRILVVLAAAVAAGCASRRAPAVAAPAAAARPATPVAADRPLSDTAANAVKAAKADDAATIICRVERPTGSNIAKRICRTKEQIERDRRAAQDMLTRPRGGQVPES